MSDVSTPNTDHRAMSPYWKKVSAILGGTDVMRQSKQYLPKLPNETETDYKHRLGNAKFTNVIQDILEDLASRPFVKKVDLEDSENDPTIVDFIDDVDGQGTNLHSFAADSFFHGLAYALDWIYVDWSNTDGAFQNRSQEIQAGARPYWVHIRAEDMLDVKMSKINGVYKYSNCRFRENAVIQEGYEEKLVERVREVTRYPQPDGTGNWSKPVWNLWEKTVDQTTGKVTWEIVAFGEMSIAEIPLQCFSTGRRKGASFQFVPLLQAAVDLQLELFEEENDLKYSKQSTAFPMLAGNGVEPDIDEATGSPKPIKAGPKAVLYAPPQEEGSNGKWEFVEPPATSLTFLAEDAKATKNDLRELGRQPLTAQTGNLTVVTTAFAANKGNSAVKSAATNLKMALEGAMRFTAMWLNSGAEVTEEIKVSVFTDFDINIMDDDGIDSIEAARDRKDISQATYWKELRRRNYLGPDFDAEREEEAISEEFPLNDDDDQGDRGQITLTPPMPQ